ncbi:MAG: hypothetical protein H8E03_00080 [Pelagibacteraceae bacterium]|nr:hypothetical protein [Pelagibacteraceae bacterium]
MIDKKTLTDLIHKMNFHLGKDELHPHPDESVATSNILNNSELIFNWPNVSSVTSPMNILHPNTDVLVERGKKVCSAFYGESFTFGDSLATTIESKRITDSLLTDLNTFTKSNPIVESLMWEWDYPKVKKNTMRQRNDNFTFRMNNNIGGHFSRRIDTDYYLNAVPGQSNTDIITGLENSIDQIASTYDKVYVVVQLTETGRDWQGRGYYNNELMKFNNTMSFYEYFTWYEQWFSNKLNDLQEKYPNCEFIVWRNFTRWMGADFKNVKVVDKVMIDYYWELLQEYSPELDTNRDNIRDDLKHDIGDSLKMSICGPDHWNKVPHMDTWSNSSHILRLYFDFLKKDIKNMELILAEVEYWEIAMNFMRHKHNIFEGRGSYHPSSIGNKVFADYIIESLKL